MSYPTFENSVQDGQPIELFDFSVGTTHYRYTSSEDTILYSSQTYAPRQITRTSPTLGSSSGRQTMEITLPNDDPVSARFIGVSPPEATFVRVIRFHRGDSPNGEVMWEGRVSGSKFEKQGVVCRMYTVPTESALTQSIPADKFQSLCNHLLGDVRCTIDLELYKHQANATAVTNNVLTVSGLFAAHGADWALGGTVEFGDDFRLVLGQDGDDLTLSLAFLDSPLGQQVDVFAGCDHSLATCRDKFGDNVINFGGSPYVPVKNPFNSGVR